jgi:hypothetical protein
MSQDAESQVIANTKIVEFLTIQLDESIDITGKAQFLAISTIICNGDIIEQFLFCKPLTETTKGKDILDVIDSYFSSYDLSLRPCISICIDNASSMPGNLKGFVALANKNNSGFVYTRCFLQREILISRSAVSEVQNNIG